MAIVILVTFYDHLNSSLFFRRTEVLNSFSGRKEVFHLKPTKKKRGKTLAIAMMLQNAVIFAARTDVFLHLVTR